MKLRLGTVGMVGTTVAAAIAFYTVSLSVATERTTVERLERKVASERTEIRALEAELRTRARLPVLQRWNDNVLGLAAPLPKQFAADAYELAAYAPGAGLPGDAAPAAAQVQFAVAREGAPVAAPTGPMLTKATFQVGEPVAVAAAPKPVAPVAVKTGPIEVAAALPKPKPSKPKADPLGDLLQGIDTAARPGFQTVAAQ